MNPIYCTKCGSENAREANFCDKCGKKVETNSQEEIAETVKKRFWDISITRNPNYVILLGVFFLIYSLFLGICIIFGTLANKYAKKNWVTGLLFLIPVFAPIFKISSSAAEKALNDPLVYGVAPASAITAYVVAVLGDKLGKRRNLKIFLILLGVVIIFSLFYSVALSLNV